MAVTIGGAYFGPIGMFLGVPVMGLAKIVITDLIEIKEQKNKELKAKARREHKVSKEEKLEKSKA
jgi:predicted PurR-regulated permease PerM